MKRGKRSPLSRSALDTVRSSGYNSAMTTQQDSEPDVLAYTLSEAARELNLSPTQISRLLDQGRLTDARFVRGSGRYVTAESVTRYRRERETS